MTQMIDHIESALKKLRLHFTKDDVLTSLPHRLLYAHDASAYRIIPVGIVFPKTTDDIIFLMKWAKQFTIGLTFRSAGTSLSGQAVGHGLIVDCSKYWKHTSFEELTHIVTVEPGIIGGHVNRMLARYHRKIGPDPASINACMMGGILANNASGMCCGIEYNSYHTIESLECIFPDGTVFDSSLENADELLMSQSPELYKGLQEIRDAIISSPELIQTIRHKYRLKNTVGYCLNAFLDESNPANIIKRLLIGSEGTLGFITKARLQTLPTLPYAATAILFFKSIDDACQAIPVLTQTNPAALELMDRSALRSIEHQDGAPEIISSLGDDATGILIEYQSHSTDELSQSIHAFNKILELMSLIEIPEFTTDTQKRQQYWNIRKGMFPSVGASRAKGTGIINEDIAVPVHSLSNAVKDLRHLFATYHFDEAIIFGHAKEGNLHFVIAHSFDTPEEIQHFGNFMNDLAIIIIDKYNGSMKAEHGTGRNIAPFVAHEWGEEAYQLMKQVKSLFDPSSILNPGIIINDDPNAHISHVKPFPIVDSIIDSCIECGYCEHVCPTHQATLSPRQRIILDRELAMMTDVVAKNELESFAAYDQIHSCATDGLCSLACPVNINTGEYMIAKRSVENIKQGRSFKTEAAAIKQRDKSITLRLHAGSLVSKVIGDGLLTSISSIVSRQFGTPQWIPSMPSPWKQVRYIQSVPEIMYIPSCSTRLFAKPIGEEIAIPDLIIALAQKAGIKITIPDNVESRCCGLAYASKGDKNAEEIASMDWQYGLPTDIPVLTDSYSCHAHIQDKMHTINILDFAERLLDMLPIQPLDGVAIIHPPCSLQLNKSIHTLTTIAKRCAREVFIPESIGCCGFAGDHGFHHPELVHHACKEMKEEIALQQQVIGYYSINPTCELGMSIGTGKGYKSILYLLHKSISS
jgi:D-lactate dehydrogenase